MKTAYLFSGQGSQYVGMNRIFPKNYTDLASHFFELSNKILNYNIYDIIKNGPEDKLNNTKYTCFTSKEYTNCKQVPLVVL